MVVYSLAIPGILALILGVLVLIWPKFLRYAVGIYLIITGISQLLGGFDLLSFSPF